MPAPAALPGPIVLVSGDETLLVDRAVLRVLTAVRRADPECFPFKTRIIETDGHFYGSL